MPCRYLSFRSSSWSTGNALSFAIRGFGAFAEAFGRESNHSPWPVTSLCLFHLVESSPFRPALLDLRELLSEESDQLNISWIVFLNSLSVARGYIRSSSASRKSASICPVRYFV